jgi:hypothetical protein
MSRHDTLTLTQYEEQVKNGSSKHTEDVVDGIIDRFNRNTRRGNVEGSGEIYRVFNRSVDRTTRNDCYDIILKFLLLPGVDDSFPTIRSEIKCIFIRPTLLLNSPFTLPKYSIIPSFYALEFTLLCMGWVDKQVSEELFNSLKNALDGLDNSHSITAVSVCQLFYYTDDKSPYPIIDKIFVLCEQIQSQLNAVGMFDLFTTFSINRLLSTYMMYSIIKRTHNRRHHYDLGWISPSDFAPIEDCSPNVAYIDEPVKRYTFFKDKYADIKYIQDILEIIQPVSLLSQHASRTPSTMVYSLVRKSPEQLKRERSLRKKMKKQGPESVSRSVISPKGGKKNRSRHRHRRRHPASTKRRTKRRRRY